MRLIAVWQVTSAADVGAREEIGHADGPGKSEALRGAADSIFSVRSVAERLRRRAQEHYEELQTRPSAPGRCDNRSDRTGRPDLEVNRRRSQEVQPWMLFAFPAAIVIPIIAGFLLGGPVVGFLSAVVIASAIVGAAIGIQPPYAGDRGWRKAAARRFLVPLAIAIAGIVLIAAGSGTVRIVGWGIFAIAITVALSLVFLEVGYSEDRARAREERARGNARRRHRERSSAR